MNPKRNRLIKVYHSKHKNIENDLFDMINPKKGVGNFQDDKSFKFTMLNGIMRIESDDNDTSAYFQVPNRDEFLNDYFFIMKLVGHKELYNIIDYLNYIVNI